MLANAPDYARSAPRTTGPAPACSKPFAPQSTIGPTSPIASLLPPSPFRPPQPMASSLRRQRVNSDATDLFRTPWMTPSPRKGRRKELGPLPALASAAPRTAPMPIEDEEGGIFLSSTPMVTPIKGGLHTSLRAALSPVQVNGLPSATRGAKRKPTPSLLNHSPEHTPARGTRASTPLNTTPGASFDRLAPLPAPRFVASTPQSKADTDASIKTQTASMTKLRILDRKASQELDEELDTEAQEEVAAAISPDGHVTKRRARTRPVSEELRSTVVSPSPPTIQFAFPSIAAFRCNQSPSSSSSSDAGSPRTRRRRNGSRVRTRASGNASKWRPTPLARIPNENTATLFFGPSIPSTTAPRVHESSPAKRQRPKMKTRRSHADSDQLPTWNMASKLSSPRSAMDEEEDMFFSGAADVAFASESGPPESSGPWEGASPSPRKTARPRESLPKKFAQRDSGVGFEEFEQGSFRILGENVGSTSRASVEWGMPPASTSVSTVQSSSGDELAGLVTPQLGPGEHSVWPPRVALLNHEEEEEEEDNALANLSVRTMPDTDAFILRTLAAGAKGAPAVPDQRGGKKAPGTPQKKVRTSFGGGRPWQSAFAPGKIGLPNGRPTPALGGKGNKKKPRVTLPAAFPELPATQLKPTKRRGPPLTLGIGAGGKKMVEEDSDSDVDKDSPSAMRQVKYDGLGLGRPSLESKSVTKGVAQRARMLMRRTSSGQFESGSESAGSVGTPTRKGGIGRSPLIPSQFSPSAYKFKFNREASSGSAGSAVSTIGSFNSPTTQRLFKGLPISAPQPLRSSTELFQDYVTVPSFRLAPVGQSSASTDSSRTSTPCESVGTTPTMPAAPPCVPRVRLLSMSAEDHRAGWFEREFVEVDDLGSGEFGRAMKVRRKDGPEDEVFAVKRSRQFEGPRQRLRLKEEVAILKHLARTAGEAGVGGGRHPNVLAYVDAWEQDEALFIQTELCTLGNFARFLWEYGRVVPRLDEARVWKIFADLSAGVCFMHESGVIHLDLKPANIFITAAGRFKLGDFGMASRWPRPPPTGAAGGEDAGGVAPFEREGDKVYLAAEVLQGQYGFAADIFSFGMIMLETASNIVVPDQGEEWHRLRREDFAQVELAGSPELFGLVRAMMRADPAARLDARAVRDHPVVLRAREAVERDVAACVAEGRELLEASPLGVVAEGFLEEVLGRPIIEPAFLFAGDEEFEMDLSP